MRGFALSSTVPGVTFTPQIARAHLESLRRVEAMWVDYLTNPPVDDLAATANADMWERRAIVDVVFANIPGNIPVDPDWCRIELLPDFSVFPDVPADDIAFHTVDSLGRPICYISYATAGADWTSASTHEMHESRVDGPCFGTVTAPDGTDWAREIDDPLQGSDYEEWGCPGIKVSNAAGPRYFGLAESGPLDIAGVVTSPFQELPSGYHESTGSDGVTRNVYGDAVTEATKARLDRTGPRAGFRRNQKRQQETRP